MALFPPTTCCAMSFASVPELLDELRAGRMIVVLDDEDRENEGDLLMAAQFVRPDDINFMAREARGLICLTLTRQHCERLHLPLMVRDNRSRHSTRFTVSIEAAHGVSTGISAHDRAHTIRTAVASDAAAADLVQPGHIFPLMAEDGGVLVRAGHTEAGVDYMRLAGLDPAAVIVEVMAEDGSMARRPALEQFAARHGLKVGSIADLIRYRLQHETSIERVLEREVDTAHGRFRLVVYRDRVEQHLHYALLRGNPDPQQPVLVRVHVHNPLGDLLQLRDDSASVPLAEAFARIAAEPAGALLILAPHEPAEPWQATALGAGAVPGGAGTAAAAPRAHGDPVSQWRRTGLGAQILADLGLRRLRLLGTPRKHPALAGFGIEVVDFAGT
jgi:3,4-dihydroxy 2-butanone 4-phosphate synthase/GTP cyclohydrolase II